MASVSTDKSGLRRVRFTDHDKKQQTIRLGRVPVRTANEVKTRVESILSARLAGLPIDSDTAAWIGKQEKKIADKLAAVGLIAKREERVATTLGDFTKEYIDSRTDIKSGTRENLFHSRRRLLEVFHEGRDIRSITEADADKFGFRLKGNLAEATAARTIKHARQFFTAAKRAKLVDSNPFECVKPGSMENRDRLHFVSAEDAEKLLAAAPDHHWRLLIALARFGGLRTPSEPLALTWEDVDWEKGRIRIDAPKTGIRWIPLFPELRPHLEEAKERACPGEAYVFTKTRDVGKNFRTTFEKIILRAGLTPWERPFQNLRASRETELAQDYPLHVVTAWIGNSVKVAAKHYLQVRDTDFEKASRLTERGDPKSGQVVAQKAAKSVSNSQSQFATGSTKDVVDVGVRRDMLQDAANCTNEQTTRLGFEPRQREPKSLVLPLHYRVKISLRIRFESGRPVVRVGS
jgi:integrase